MGERGCSPLCKGGESSRGRGQHREGLPLTVGAEGLGLGL